MMRRRRSSVVLSTHGLHKFFIGRQSVIALRDVSIDIYKGEFLVILGPSGCGKSTLLNMLGGLDHPTTGEVYLYEDRLHGQPEETLTSLRQKHIGVVFQHFNLLSGLTAAENVALPLRLTDMPMAEQEQRIQEMLEMVGLAHRKNHVAAKLSGGEQQRVAVARALVHRPTVILADEPTGNLDQANSRLIKELLNKCNKELKQTVVVVSHDASFKELADRVIYMRDGRIERTEVRECI